VKILLDECVPAQVRYAFAGHDVTSVQEQGWTGIKNGDLLAAGKAPGLTSSLWPTRTFAISRILAAGG
jgi:hypothetical protein